MPDTFCLIHSLPEVIFEKEFCGSGVEWDRRLCVEFQLQSTLRLWKQELKCKLIMLGRREGACPSLCTFLLQCCSSRGSPGQLTVLFPVPGEDRCWYGTRRYSWLTLSRLHYPWVHNQSDHGWYCAEDRAAFTLLWLFLFLWLATFIPKSPRFLLVLYTDLIIINGTHGRKEKQICFVRYLLCKLLNLQVAFLPQKQTAYQVRVYMF